MKLKQKKKKILKKIIKKKIHTGINKESFLKQFNEDKSQKMSRTYARRHLYLNPISYFASIL